MENLTLFVNLNKLLSEWTEQEITEIRDYINYTLQDYGCIIKEIDITPKTRKYLCKIMQNLKNVED